MEMEGAGDVEDEEGDVFADACAFKVGCKAIAGEGHSNIDKSLDTVESRNTVDEGCNIVDDGCGAIDEHCKAVDGGNIFAGTPVVDMGRKAVGGEVDNVVDEGLNAVAEVCETTAVDRGAVDEGLNAVDKGHDTVESRNIVEGCNPIDEGCNPIVEGRGDVDEGDVLACVLTSSLWMGIG